MTSDRWTSKADGPDVALHPHVLAAQDLKRSGLGTKEWKAMRLEVLTSDQTFELTGKFKSRAVKFPYLDPRRRDTGHLRLRFLDDVRGFGAGHAARKQQRYWQPPGSPPRAYFPPLVEWEEALRDPGVELWVTEGEKKAAALCKAGVHCVGLGGVYAWQSKGRGQHLVPDLALVEMRGRTFVLCFDTEADANPLVAGAMEKLGLTLQQRGAEVRVVRLPLLDGEEKTGLDDFLVARGLKPLLAIAREGLSGQAELMRLNERLARIGSPTAVMDLETGEMHKSPQLLQQVAFASVRVPHVDAAGRLTTVSAVKAWLEWPGHRMHPRVAFEPGEPRVAEDGALNLWRGWPLEPRRGDVSLFRELLDYVLGGLTPAERRWAEQWMAYPLQRPGAKLYTALVLWGQGQGIGKSVLGYTLGRLYGDAFAVVTEADLHSQFNEWAACRQLVLGEEITGSERRSESNRLKHLVTGETARVNNKYQAVYTLRNCANFVFTTNDGDAFLLDRQDRRYFVHEVGRDAKHPGDRWFQRTYHDWYRSADGAAALMHHLLRVDLTGFEPRGKAPQTVARAAMVEASGTDADVLVRAMLEAPNQYLRVGGTPVARDLFTLDELLALLDPERRVGLKLRALGSALRRAGVASLDVTRTASGTLRLWPVRDGARWARAAPEERREHYDEAPGAARKPKFA
jgi:hypothetical protein